MASDVQPQPGQHESGELSAASAGPAPQQNSHRPAAGHPRNSKFCSELHQAAMGDCITAIWEDERAQRGTHSHAFNPDLWQIITTCGAVADASNPYQLREPPLPEHAHSVVRHGPTCRWAITRATARRGDQNSPI